MRRLSDRARTGAHPRWPALALSHMKLPALPPIPRLALIAGLLAALVISVLLLRRCAADSSVPPVVVMDTANAAAWRARSETQSAKLAEALAEQGGLRGALQRAENRVRGLEVRRPTSITVYDTIVDLRRDTVILTVQVDKGGNVTMDRATPDSAGHRPETARIQLGNCDDQMTITPSGVVCDRAVFGHLMLFAQAGGATEISMKPLPELRAAAGLSWTPAYRSTLQVDLGVDLERRAFLLVRKGVRLF